MCKINKESDSINIFGTNPDTTVDYEINQFHKLLAKAKIMGLDVKEIHVGERIPVIMVSMKHNNSHIIYIDERIHTFIRNELVNEIKKLGKANIKIIGGKGLNSLCYTFSTLNLNTLDLYGFNTENITSFQEAFSHTRISNILGTEKFSTSKLTDCNGMFAYAYTENLNLSNWSNEQLKNMNIMFIGFGAKELQMYNFSTPKVECTKRMFCNARIPNLDLRSLNLNNKVDKTEMFYGTDTNQLDIRNIYVNGDTYSSEMFTENYIKRVIVSNNFRPIDVEYYAIPEIIKVRT